ncbi:hypothetical protein GCK72_000085 [Caenorhabditis remanei]|uniref:RGS domain-containing protein n=1 Tax=Caenorhabditis remanei TaxID=31234 RepID=A0A6A5HPT0_CAERE|nr:hypothetical protein GCK72_000085 [Caenorhabditis remanei]KAF1768273.1 hypothetical protein GCK72_000085 [Caenorhabditis remanei]
MAIICCCPSRTTTHEKPKKVTFELVLKWGVSFEELLNHETGRRAFTAFLKSEYSDENILFWIACEEIKRERNSEKVEEKARIIYEDFVSILSSKEVSLDATVREKINENMKSPTSETFNIAQKQIYTLMQRDSYPRFIVSPIYRELRDSFGVIEEVVNM